MSTDTNFRGHYDEWTTKRINFIESHFGAEWFRGKRILELGCGYARISSHFARLGALMTCSDARSEHIAAVKARDPNLNAIEADLNHQWPFEGRYDLILHLGLLYHLEDIHFSLQRTFESSDHAILETEVSDSLNDQTIVPVDENKAMYDQSFTGRGSRPSAGYLERFFAEHGFRALRLSDDRCNSSHEGLHHVYDWPCQDTESWEHGRRRLWILTNKAICPPPSSDNISVVVQGPIVGMNHKKHRKRITQKCLASIRNSLPKAEIILSTWEGAETDGLDCDAVVKSKDPGATMFDFKHKVYNNINRQIVSSHEGIQQAQREYCLKIRSDLLLESDRFLEHWGKYDRYQWQYKFTSSRILNSSVYTRKFAGVSPRTTRIPFHPGDFLFFGLRHDLAGLFNIPLAKEPESSLWFKSRKPPTDVHDCYATAMCRFFPEQYLWLGYLSKFIDLPIKDRLDLKSESLQHDIPCLINNFVCLDQSQWHYSMPKYNLRQFMMESRDWDGLFRHDVWKKHYSQLCDEKIEDAYSYDTRMRYVFHDKLEGLEKNCPKFTRYLNRKVRKLPFIR